VNTECPIFDVRCKPDEWDQRADTPEPADGMVMVEVREGSFVWGMAMQALGSSVQYLSDISGTWCPGVCGWCCHRLKPAEGGES